MGMINHYQKHVHTGITTEEFLDYLIESASTDTSKFVRDGFYTTEIEKNFSMKHRWRTM